MANSTDGNDPRNWVLAGEDGPARSREALDLMVLDGLIQLEDSVEPAGGGQSRTVGEVLGILPALPVSQRLDALAQGLELPDGQTVDTMKSDELPRVVSMIPRVDTMPVSKPTSGNLLTPQRLGAIVTVVLGIAVVAFLMMPRGDEPLGPAEGQKVKTASAAAGSGERLVPVKRPPEALLRPGQKRLSLEEKQKVLEAELEDLESCLPDRYPGRVQIELKIKPNGAPFAIRLNSEEQSITVCVRAKIFRWRFPRFSGPSDALAFQLGAKR